MTRKLFLATIMIHKQRDIL